MKDLKRMKIAVLRARGMSDQDIADELGVAPSTITYHKGILQEKDKGFIQEILKQFKNLTDI